MDPIIIVAIIGAISTVLSAYITSRYKDQQILNSKTEKMKIFEHMLLFWHRGEKDWAENDWDAAEEYIAKFTPVCGFSREYAQFAKKVTIIGAKSGIDGGAERFLEKVGCKVERLDGKEFEDTAELLNRRVRANKAFEGGGLHRLGYDE